MTRVLLDTSAYSAFMLGHPEAKVALQHADEIYLTPVVLGELLAGFIRGKWRKKNERELRAFLSAPRVQVIDVALRHQLQSTMHAIRVHVHPAVRMFFVAAFLGENVRVYRFATVRAVPDWGIGTSVIHVWTPIPSHCDTLRSN